MEVNFNKVFSKVFMWVFIGLIISFATGFFVSTNTKILLGAVQFVWLIVVAELILSLVFIVRIWKMNKTTATILYLLYTFLTGITFAFIFIAYKLDSILISVAITALITLALSVYALTTKKDITNIGTYLLMALIGMLLCYILNIFLNNPAFNTILAYVSIAIFSVYIGYDVQKVKQNILANPGISEDNVAIYGAFQIYLDFINIFIRILELMGKRKD